MLSRVGLTSEIQLNLSGVDKIRTVNTVNFEEVAVANSHTLIVMDEMSILGRDIFVKVLRNYCLQHDLYFLMITRLDDGDLGEIIPSMSYELHSRNNYYTLVPRSL